MEEKYKANDAYKEMYHPWEKESNLSKCKNEHKLNRKIITSECGEYGEKTVCSEQLPRSGEERVHEQLERSKEAEQSYIRKRIIPPLSESSATTTTATTSPSSSLLEEKPFSSESEAIVKEEDEINEEEAEPSESSTSSVSNEGNNTPPLVYNFCSYPHCPTYIPSKGRYEQERGTISNLIKELIPFTVVTEPAEAKLYSQLLDHLVYKYFGPSGMCCPSSDTYNSTGGNDAEPLFQGKKDVSVEGKVTHSNTYKIVANAERERAHEETDEFHYQSEKYHYTDKETDFDINFTQNLQRRFDNLYHNGYDIVLGSFVNQNANFRLGDIDDKCYENDDDTNKEEVSKKSVKVSSTRKKKSTFNSSNNNDYIKGNDDDVNANLYTKKKEYSDQSKLMSATQEFLSHNKFKSKESISEVAKGVTRFVSTIEEIRNLFTVSILPENNKGVAYVRNYILQILVPQNMIEAGIDKTGHIDELNMFNSQDAKMLNENALRSMNLDQSVYAELSAYESFKPTTPHDLVDFYWVLDDDIYVLYRTDEREKRNIRITFRDMINEVCRRVSYLKEHSEESCKNKQSNEVYQSTQKSNMAASGSEQNEYTIFTQSTPSSFSGITSHSLINGKPVIFSCREACINNNEIKDRTGCVRGNTLYLDNYVHYSKTACYSLEYSRFAFSYDDASMAINSYNTIACLFNYRILHSPAQEAYFPSNLFTGVRSVKDVLSAGWCLECNDNNKSRNTMENFSIKKASSFENNNTDSGVGSNSNVNSSTNVNRTNYNKNDEDNETTCGINKSARTERNILGNFRKNALISAINSSTSMMWYRFAVREDYDFTLQLIARGYCTVRFRNLSFEVPQMSKVKGGMTDYYKNCVDDMQYENKRFVQQWPAISQHWIKGKNVTERDDIRVRWDLLHPSRTRYPGAYLYLRFPLPSLQPQRRLINDKPGKNAFRSENNIHEMYAPTPTAETAKSMSNNCKRPERNFTAKEFTIASTLKNDERNVPITTHETIVETSPVNAKDKLESGREIRECKRSRAVAGITDNESAKNIDYKTIHLHHKNCFTDNTVSDDSEEITHWKNQECSKNNNVDRLIDRPASMLANISNNSASWKGYAIEQWRDITDDEALSLGLCVLSPESLRAGQSVAVILPFFSQNPSVALAVLIEKSSLAREHCVRWNAVVQNVPGVAFLSVKKCYEVPRQGIKAASRAVDDFFNKLQTEHA